MKCLLAYCGGAELPFLTQLVGVVPGNSFNDAEHNLKERNDHFLEYL